LMKTIVDINKDLVNVHETRKKAQGSSASTAPPAGQNNQQNNFFVGGPADLAKLLKENQK